MIILKIIIYIDITFLITNIYLLLFFQNNFIYKNIDRFYFILNTHSIDQISEYLNRKYLKSNNQYDSSQINKKYISLYFINFNDEPFHNTIKVVEFQIIKNICFLLRSNLVK